MLQSALGWIGRVSMIGSHYPSLMRGMATAARKPPIYALRPLVYGAFPVTPTKLVPSTIRKPDYVLAKPGSKEEEAALSDDCYLMLQTSERDGMREAGLIARQALDLAKKMAVAGTTTDAIDQAVHEFIVENQAYPSPLLYRRFPKSCCTSINEVIAHGIPDGRPLEGGDLLNIDVTVYTRSGFHGDCSETLIVEGGDIDSKRLKALENLKEVAKQSVFLGIEKCGPDQPVASIGKAIYKFVQSEGYDVIPDLTGHGIGLHFHTEPYICPTIKDNYPSSIRMLPGMCFTIEPVIATGVQTMNTWSDDWTLVSTDRSISAQFEHTVLITECGCEILTLSSTA